MERLFPPRRPLVGPDPPHAGAPDPPRPIYMGQGDGAPQGVGNPGDLCPAAPSEVGWARAPETAEASAQKASAISGAATSSCPAVGCPSVGEEGPRGSRVAEWGQGHTFFPLRNLTWLKVRAQRRVRAAGLPLRWRFLSPPSPALNDLSITEPRPGSV